MRDRPGFPQVQAELDRIMSEQRQYLEQLKKAAHDATGGRYRGNGDPSGPTKASPRESRRRPRGGRVRSQQRNHRRAIVRDARPLTA